VTEQPKVTGLGQVLVVKPFEDHCVVWDRVESWIIMDDYEDSGRGGPAFAVDWKRDTRSRFFGCPAGQPCFHATVATVSQRSQRASRASPAQFNIIWKLPDEIRARAKRCDRCEPLRPLRERPSALWLCVLCDSVVD
jgi:hypothetical protein